MENRWNFLSIQRYSLGVYSEAQIEALPIKPAVVQTLQRRSTAWPNRWMAYCWTCDVKIKMTVTGDFFDYSKTCEYLWMVMMPFNFSQIFVQEQISPDSTRNWNQQPKHLQKIDLLPQKEAKGSSSNHPFSGANLLLLSGRRKNSQHSSRPPPPQGCNQTLQERRTSTLVLVGVGSCVSPKLSTWQLGAMCKSCHLMMVFHAFDFRDLVKIANKITGCSLIISFFAVTSNSSTDSTCFILSTSTSRPKTAAGPATRILPAAAVLWEHPQ